MSPDRVVRRAAVAVAIASMLQMCLGKCPPDNGTATRWVSIPPDQYDRNYSSVVSENRPLGFVSSVLYYNVPDAANPCIEINTGDSQNRHMEIMFQTDPLARLCYRYEGIAEPECSMGMLNKCFRVPSQPKTYVEFTCDNSCENQDVNFWYRFVLSPTSGPELAEVNGDPELWCMGRSADEYPQNLISLPSGATFPGDVVVGGHNDAPSVSSASLSILVLSSLISVVNTNL